MRATKYAELPSSLHTVMSSNDLLIEILLCLPAISILECKSVSKRWLSLITDTIFTLRCSQIPKLDSPSGLFIPKPKSSVFEYNLVPLDVKLPWNMSLLDITFTFGSEEGNVEILQSCNGLLLCCSGIEPYKLCVYNPTINMFKMIPRPLGSLDLDRFDMTASLKMAFDPTKSLYYKVLYVGMNDDAGYSYIEIQTYSSETGYWNVCGDRFSWENFSYFCTAIYWNDAFHWLSCLDNPIHFRLDIGDRPVLTSIHTPGNLLYNSRLFVSLGCLLFLCRLGNYSDELYVYEMRKGIPDVQ
nr:hypothetical protein [Tanacetum cinerariifolium]GFA06230.1 hypothetical protein [Tanacetum cinerariifolium]